MKKYTLCLEYTFLLGIYSRFLHFTMKHQRCAILSIACKGCERNQATTLQAPKVRNNGAFGVVTQKEEFQRIKNVVVKVVVCVKSLVTKPQTI